MERRAQMQTSSRLISWQVGWLGGGGTLGTSVSGKGSGGGGG